MSDERTLKWVPSLVLLDVYKIFFFVHLVGASSISQYLSLFF